MDLERPAEAIPCFDEAIAVHEGIVRGEGTWQDVREIGVSVMNRGLALMHLGRNEDALACFEHALDGFRQCRSNKDIACALINCGDLYFRQERLDEALAALEESVDILEPESAVEPDASRGDYAYALSSRADVLQTLGRLNDALDSSDRSIVVLRAVVSNVNNPPERRDLAKSINLRGHILNKLGRTKEAQECFREAAELKQKRRES